MSFLGTQNRIARRSRIARMIRIKQWLRHPKLEKGNGRRMSISWEKNEALLV